MNRRDFFNRSANLVSGLTIGHIADDQMNARFTELTDWLNAKYDALALDSKKAVAHLYEELTVTSQLIDKRLSRIEMQQFLLMVWATVLTLVSGIDLISPLVQLI